MEIEDAQNDKVLEALDILQRLAGACQDYPEILPDDVRTVLSEWESFSEG